MNNSVVAYIRTPTDEKLKHMREPWSALKQKSLPASTDIGVELQTCLRHAVRMVGIIHGLHPVTGKRVKFGPFPLSVTEDGVKRVHDSAQLWSAIVSLWTSGSGNS